MKNRTKTFICILLGSIIGISSGSSIALTQKSQNKRTKVKPQPAKPIQGCVLSGILYDGYYDDIADDLTIPFAAQCTGGNSGNPCSLTIIVDLSLPNNGGDLEYRVCETLSCGQVIGTNPIADIVIPNIGKMYGPGHYSWWATMYGDGNCYAVSGVVSAEGGSFWID